MLQALRCLFLLFVFKESHRKQLFVNACAVPYETICPLFLCTDIW